jgi:hypothetical protein
VASDSNLPAEVASRTSRRVIGLVLIIVLGVIAGAIVGGLFFSRAFDVSYGPTPVAVTNVAALRHSIDTFVVLSKYDKHNYSVTTRVSPIDRRWQFFTVTWSDGVQPPVYGFGYWQGQWALHDIAFSRPGCIQHTRQGVLYPDIPTNIRLSFHLRC